MKGFHDLADKFSDDNLELILVDGNKFNPYKIPHKCVIKGDTIYKSIAAASILAKTERDLYMDKLSLEYPVYNWSKNKGYCTKDHDDAINKNGITKYHRRTFGLCKNF